jgi:hypothetical protein
LFKDPIEVHVWKEPPQVTRTKHLEVLLEVHCKVVVRLEFDKQMQQSFAVVLHVLLGTFDIQHVHNPGCKQTNRCCYVNNALPDGVEAMSECWFFAGLWRHIRGSVCNFVIAVLPSNPESSW